MALFRRSKAGKKPAVSVSVSDREINALQRKLKGFPQKLQRRAIRPAINKAATPVVKAARREISSLQYSTGKKPDGTPRPPLKKTISKRVKTYKNTGAVVAIIGSKSRSAPHAHLVHDGTKPHKISVNGVVRIPLFGNRTFNIGTIQHPGAKANPYLERALNNSRSQVKTALVKGLKAGIEKVAKLK